MYVSFRERVRNIAAIKKKPRLDHEILYLAQATRMAQWTETSPVLHESYPRNDFGQKNAACRIGALAESGFNCAPTLPYLIDGLENETPWYVKSNIAMAILKMASVGTDCSMAKPALLACAENEYADVKCWALAALRVMETTPVLVLDREAMRVQLTRAVGEFERSGLGSVGTVLVVNQKTMDAFIRLRGYGFRALPFPFSLFVDDSVPQDISLLANAIPGVLWSNINLWATPHFLEDVVTKRTLIHEFVHISEYVVRCMARIEKQLRSRYGNDKAKYLSRIIEEGFASFVSRLLSNDPEREMSFKNAFTCSELHIREIERTLKEYGWPRVATDERCGTFVYTIGMNFFAQAHPLLERELPEYMQLMASLPPNSDELLSKDGGASWASRV